MRSRDKAEVSSRLTSIGIIPVVRAESTDMARRAVAAILKGGISVLEITMTVPGAVDVIKGLTAEIDPEVIIGAGTVMDAQTAQACIEAGAQFIVSPALSLETIAFCNQQGVLVMPGALTPSEVVAAWSAGADFVKVFPAGAVGGASYLKALKAPLPQIKLVPTGGVSLQTAAAFIKAGAEALGVGGDLVDIKALREGRDELVTDRARLFVDIVKQARAK
ncbi:MAG TPA: bifunctional 4-hydroxy-2-oxoglutarate aldolase/2-dehydro-3-deoxy-phosphogluconate aldolase [Polyangia bacterium]|jgi:Entner-Doudoroff aldolase|nr:bifunctional 4-hydroxy-2-oxoglutarate aldolase/2-dehydro-3-deoxy-phosphogluconate aldolase [Polyangia bacterium]